MRILSLSDMIVPYLYSPQVRRYAGVDMIVGCGDLAYYYLEYVYDALDAPLYFVRGNHDKVVEYSSAGQRTHPHGGRDLHCQAVRQGGCLIAGIQGSVRYRLGEYQYSQMEMWENVLRLAPRLIWNRARYGRYLDVFVSHAPPAGIHEADDPPHRGIRAFRWLLEVFRPRLHLHGHIHVYRPDTATDTLLGATRVVNTYGFRMIDLPDVGASSPTR